MTEILVTKPAVIVILYYNNNECIVVQSGCNFAMTDFKVVMIMNVVTLYLER